MIEMTSKAEPSTMYQLYIANKNYSSWSLRPWVLMRQLGIAFDEQLQVFQGATNWRRFRQFSPTGRVPTLVDDKATVWDSLAITEYLAERHIGVWPADAQARAYARCAAAEMHAGYSALRNECSMNCGIRVRLNAPSSALQTEIARLNELWGDGLARFGGPFLAGTHFTAVDAFFAPVAFRFQTYDIALNTTAANYAKRLLALPAMQEWYTAGIKEAWRDADHEAEVHLVGTITADCREPPR
jgi:glutathione S-transferase